MTTREARGFPDGLFADNLAKAQQPVPQRPRTNPAVVLEQYNLLGLIGGSTPQAIIHVKQTGETFTVGIGEDVGEFAVEAITPRSVILRWEEESFELTL